VIDDQWQGEDGMERGSPSQPTTVEREEVEATLAARRELGEALEPALIASFLDRIEARLDGRLAERPRAAGGTDWGALGLAAFSVVGGVAALDTAASYGEPLLAVVAWAGLAAINWAYGRRARR
jgi:hypothetical protein